MSQTNKQAKKPTGKFATSNKLSTISVIFAFVSILVIVSYLAGILVIVGTVEQSSMGNIILTYIRTMHYIFFGCCIVFTGLGIANCVVYGSIKKEHYEMSGAPMALWIAGMSVNMVFNIMGVIFNNTAIYFVGIVFFVFASVGTIPFIIGCFTAMKKIKKHIIGK